MNEAKSEVAVAQVGGLSCWEINVPLQLMNENLESMERKTRSLEEELATTQVGYGVYKVNTG